MIIKILVHLSRIFVGAMFVFSGFVKLVDPIGSQYKFEEYFGEGVLNLEFLIPYALPFSILLILAEIMLGVMLLLGYKSKKTVWSLLVLTAIFLFLTWYSAYYNKVTDCGCFGDAIKLTPWETFYKNVILIGLIILLLIRVKDIKEILSKKITLAITLISLLSFSYITYHVLNHLPLIDFRAYAVGKNIPDGKIYHGGDQLPPTQDFILEDTQNDLTNELMAKDKLMLLLVYNISKSEKDGFAKIKKIADDAINKGYTVYGVTASFGDELVLTQTKYSLPFDFLFCDETVLKTMIRANPGIMTFSKGTVTGKWNWTDAEDVKL
ncbi:DoxX family protein [Flavobacteriaceae bacterium S356]|uniref:DoxX family protein n=1 Tax=Asprobacillus argus TaxID=3076534 RepID=A0ABU3LG49_9FLAO|nr:DoxX family protein [Flavobacteriaceae bacterium S356]